MSAYRLQVRSTLNNYYHDSETMPYLDGLKPGLHILSRKDHKHMLENMSRNMFLCIRHMSWSPYRSGAYKGAVSQKSCSTQLFSFAGRKS